VHFDARAAQQLEAGGIERVGDQDARHSVTTSSIVASSVSRSASRTSPMCPMRNVVVFQSP
jgi:hypothetical protein